METQIKTLLFCFIELGETWLHRKYLLTLLENPFTINSASCTSSFRPLKHPWALRRGLRFSHCIWHIYANIAFAWLLKATLRVMGRLLKLMKVNGLGAFNTGIVTYAFPWPSSSYICWTWLPPAYLCWAPGFPSVCWIWSMIYKLQYCFVMSQRSTVSQVYLMYHPTCPSSCCLTKEDSTYSQSPLALYYLLTWFL